MKGFPGGFTPDIMREILAVRPMPASWYPSEVDSVPFPTCEAKTADECIAAFREANVVKQKNLWALAAVAARVERGVGGRPKRQDDKINTRKADTQIQRFCRKAGTSRNTFQRLTRTYTFFAETSTGPGTSFRHVLTFGHHEVVARLLPDFPEEAVNALAFAYRCKWTPTLLERALVLAIDRPKPNATDRWFGNRNPRRKMRRHLEKFFGRLARIIVVWPVEMRRSVPHLLRQLAEHVETTLPPKDDDLPTCLRDLVADDSDPIGEHDMEAV